jgi:hypothetical protein
VATEISSVRCDMPDKLGSRLRQVREHTADCASRYRPRGYEDWAFPSSKGWKAMMSRIVPSGILPSFLCSCVRACYGLDLIPSSTEFLEQFPDPGEVVSPTSIHRGTARAAAPSARQRPPTRLGLLWKAAVGYLTRGIPRSWLAPLGCSSVRVDRLAAAPSSRFCRSFESISRLPRITVLRATMGPSAGTVSRTPQEPNAGCPDQGEDRLEPVHVLHAGRLSRTCAHRWAARPHATPAC